MLPASRHLRASRPAVVAVTSTTLGRQAVRPKPSRQAVGARETTSCSATNGQQQRSPAAKAAIFTGCYATLAGLALALAPATSFGLLFNPAEVPKGWIRVGGILFSLIGLQYLGTGWADTSASATSFYTATVWSRLMLAAGFAAVVAIGEAPVNLLVLAALNVVGALSMAWAVWSRPA